MNELDWNCSSTVHVSHSTSNSNKKPRGRQTQNDWKTALRDCFQFHGIRLSFVIRYIFCNEIAFCETLTDCQLYYSSTRKFETIFWYLMTNPLKAVSKNKSPLQLWELFWKMIISCEPSSTGANHLPTHRKIGNASDIKLIALMYYTTPLKKTVSKIRFLLRF